MTRPRANGSDRPAGRVAVIDLGSNSVRLVVFDGLSRTPVPVFNEGVVCGLLGLPVAAGAEHASGAHMPVFGALHVLAIRAALAVVG
ncbi:MAG: hypothetical protein QF830_12875, partial [Rhodospirillales bacterium]|nr:hypothetical protein [Rhodospirillales bacterium]